MLLPTSSKRSTPYAPPLRTSSARFTPSLTSTITASGSIPPTNPKSNPRSYITRHHLNQSLAKQNRKPMQTHENNPPQPKSIASFCRLFSNRARPQNQSAEKNRARPLFPDFGKNGARSSVLGRQSCRPLRVVELLAFRIQDAQEVVAVRGVIYRGAVDIAEERLCFMQRFDFRIELIHGGGVGKNGDEGVGAGGVGVDQILFERIAGEGTVSNLSIERGFAILRYQIPELLGVTWLRRPILHEDVAGLGGAAFTVVHGGHGDGIGVHGVGEIGGSGGCGAQGCQSFHQARDRGRSKPTDVRGRVQPFMNFQNAIAVAQDRSVGQETVENLVPGRQVLLVCRPLRAGNSEERDIGVHDRLLGRLGLLRARGRRGKCKHGNEQYRQRGNAEHSLEHHLFLSCFRAWVGRAIGTAWFDLDFCLAHRMLVLLWTQRINAQRALTENPVFPRLNSDQGRHGKLVARLLAVDDAGFHYEGNFF